MRTIGLAPGLPDSLDIWTPATLPASDWATFDCCDFAMSSALMTVAEPVNASFLEVPNATTITSSIACVSSCIVTSMRDLPAMGSCCPTYPMNVTERVPSAGAESEYWPAALVVVPIEVPSTMTVAPATGFPFASETVPETCLFWANAYAPSTKTAINDSTIFLTISVNFNWFFKKKSYHCALTYTTS